MTPVGLDHAALDERAQRQRGRRDVAAGGRDQARALQLVAVQLGQPVHGLGEQRRLVVLEAVVRRVLARRP